MLRGAQDTAGGSGASRNYGSISTNDAAPDVSFAGSAAFSPTEFISLSENIGQSIQSVQSGRLFLEKALKILGTGKDSQSTRDKIHQLQSTTNNKIFEASKDVRRLGVVVRGGDKQQTLQVHTLTSKFKAAVEEYHKSQQQIASKMKVIILTSAMQQKQQLMVDEDEYNGDNSNAEDRNTLIQEQKKIHDLNMKHEQSLLKEREEKMKQVEADVLDVNYIMRELATLTNAQAPVIDTIERQINDVGCDVEQGAAELAKASQSQVKYRRKVIILLVIAVIVGLIVVSIIISSLKKS